MKNLEKYINDKTIQTNVDVNTWEEAVIHGSEPLLANEDIEKKYVDAMIDAVHEYGPYMVLADNFALMHSRPENGVLNTSMSLITTKNTLDMEGKPVKVFLILAAKDNESHIKALSQITEILSNESNFLKIMDGNKEEILNLIKGGE